MVLDRHPNLQPYACLYFTHQLQEQSSSCETASASWAGSVPQPFLVGLDRYGFQVGWQTEQYSLSVNDQNVKLREHSLM